MTDGGKVTLEEASRAASLNDGQGRWYDVLSPRRVLTAEEKLDHDMNQQQQLQQVNKDMMRTKKKKCRGNRKEQQRRRRLRRQEEKKAKKLNNEEMMNSMDQDMTVPDDEQDHIEEGQQGRMQVSCHLR